MSYTVLNHFATADLVTASDLNSIIDDLAIIKTPITDTGHIRDVGVTNAIANYTVTTSDDMVFCNSGTFTVTLPSATTMAYRRVTIKNNNAGLISMASTGGETIDNVAATLFTITTNHAVTFYSSSLNWYVVATY